MTEPQTWTIIGILAAGFFGVMGLMSTMFTRVIKSEIGGLRCEMNARFDAVDQRFNGIDRRLDVMDKRIDNIDNDVQFLTRKEMDR